MGRNNQCYIGHNIKGIKMKYFSLALFAAITLGASAEMQIDLDIKAKPIKDMKKTANGVAMGVNGAMEAWLCHIPGNDDIFFVSNKVETSRIFRQAGLRVMRLQGMNSWFNNRNKKTKDGKYPLTNPKAAFDFYKDNGIKVFVCLECWSQEAVANNLEIIKWIVDNNYKDQVVGIEMGNESYARKDYPKLAAFWPQVIDGARKIWPKVPFGIVIGEYMENDPDIAQIAQRMKSKESLHHGWTYDTGYFSAGELNRTTAKFVEAMSNHLHKVTHIIYHGYGAETPYSCSYYGFQRFRNFIEAYPQLKGKNYWLTEVRLRSDEDNRCQRIFRETLLWGHYSLMALCQPETEGLLQHQASCLSGTIYTSTGRGWAVQWMDGPKWGGRTIPDYTAPYNQPRIEVGSMGVLYRLFTEAIMDHPLFLAHGTSKARDTEDTFFTSARITDQVYAHRRALIEGATLETAPKVDGEMEWVAAYGKKELCLLMVNTKSVPQTLKVTVKDKRFYAPMYRTLSCPAEFIDCRAVPGDGPVWKQMSWEETQFGVSHIPMERYANIKPKCDVLTVKIAPHTVQTVTVPLADLPKPPKAKKK
jgi:hypothetical protein